MRKEEFSAVFIASSTEGRNVAYAIQDLLEKCAECTVWDQNVFEPSTYTIPALLEQLGKSNYGIFVFTPDDTANIREKDVEIARDNVILEFGMFVGALGLQNCFIVMPENNGNIHLPTDLIGITKLQYRPDRRDHNLMAALGPAVNKIQNVIKRNKGENVHIVPQDVIEQVGKAGLNAFYSTRDDYSRYRENAASIDKYINTANKSICMVSITLTTGIGFDNICKVIKEKLTKQDDFKVTISLLNPFDESLYRAIKPLFILNKSLRKDAIARLKVLIEFRKSLKPEEQERFILKVHNALPFGSAIILDGDTDDGTIQIETKPYNVGMRESFAFEIKNNGADFYRTLVESYYKLIDDGILWNEIEDKLELEE